MNTLNNNAVNELYLWRSTILKCLDDLDTVTIHVRNSASGITEKIATVTHANLAFSYHTIYIELTDNPTMENLPAGVVYVVTNNDYVLDFYINNQKAFTQGQRIV